MNKRTRAVALTIVMVALCTATAALAVFPGQRLDIAWTLGTGVGMPALQGRVDAVEAKLIDGQPLEPSERAFLGDLYGAMATGAQVTGVLRQSGALMAHYLQESGEDLVIDEAIFLGSRKVRAVMRALRRRAQRQGCTGGETSAPFHMPDREHLDSFFGLYWGTVSVEARGDEQGGCVLTWTAEVPWTWPTYAGLAARRGTPRAELHRLPNLQSLLWGEAHALHIHNGLGGELTDLGLARPFVARARWEERTP